MPIAEQFLAHGQGLFIRLLCLDVPALEVQGAANVMQALGHIGVLRSVQVSGLFQRQPELGFGFVVLRSTNIQFSQFVARLNLLVG